LIGELTAPTYRVLSDGKIQIERKDEMKKRGLASPNIADAHILTFAQPYAAYRVQDDEDLPEELSPYGDGYRPLDEWAGY